MSTLSESSHSSKRSSPYENYDSPNLKTAASPREVSITAALPVQGRPTSVRADAVAVTAVATPSIVSTDMNSNELAVVAIPDSFVRLLCCACTCSNCAFPSCWGCKSGGTTLCLEGYTACCKPIDDVNACFICCSADNQCVVPRTCCKRYDQCCCWECYCSLPFSEGGYHYTSAAAVSMPRRKDGSAMVNDVLICQGGCCTICSCNCNVPECLGCFSKGVCLCHEVECVCCKAVCWDESRSNKDTLCILSKGNNLLVYPYTCCKSVDQCCCCDLRRALPCDEEVPCIWSGLCFCTICVQAACNVSCCATIDEVQGQRNPPLIARSPNLPPAGQQLQQVATAQPIARSLRQ